MRRATDRRTIRNSIAGVVVFAVGLGLYLSRGFSEAGTIALMVIGGVLFQGDKLVELVRVWKNGRAVDEIQVRRKQGEEEGVEPT